MLSCFAFSNEFFNGKPKCLRGPASFSVFAVFLSPVLGLEVVRDFFFGFSFKSWLSVENPMLNVIVPVTFSCEPFLGLRAYVRSIVPFCCLLQIVCRSSSIWPSKSNDLIVLLFDDFDTCHAV